MDWYSSLKIVHLIAFIIWFVCLVVVGWSFDSLMKAPADAKASDIERKQRDLQRSGKVAI
jgi:putative copper export protein